VIPAACMSPAACVAGMCVAGGVWAACVSPVVCVLCVCCKCGSCGPDLHVMCVCPQQYVCHRQCMHSQHVCHQGVSPAVCVASGVCCRWCACRRRCEYRWRVCHQWCRLWYVCVVCVVSVVVVGARLTEALIVPQPPSLAQAGLGSVPVPCSPQYC
jgi:hypothetical protein